jgi:hypothetical protein
VGGEAIVIAEEKDAIDIKDLDVVAFLLDCQPMPCAPVVPPLLPRWVRSAPQDVLRLSPASGI